MRAETAEIFRNMVLGNCRHCSAKAEKEIGGRVCVYCYPSFIELASEIATDRGATEEI